MWRSEGRDTLSKKVLGLKIFKLFVNWLIFFLYLLKNKIIYNFVNLRLKKRKDIISLSSFLLLLDPGPGSEIRDGKRSGSGMNIPDPHYWKHMKTPILKNISRGANGWKNNGWKTLDMYVDHLLDGQWPEKGRK